MMSIDQSPVITGPVGMGQYWFLNLGHHVWRTIEDTKRPIDLTRYRRRLSSKCGKFGFNLEFWTKELGNL